MRGCDTYTFAIAPFRQVIWLGVLLTRKSYRSYRNRKSVGHVHPSYSSHYNPTQREAHFICAGQDPLTGSRF